MTNDEIPASVRELLHSRVATYEDLEVLLLLGREPSRLWSAEDVASELHVPVSSASEALAHLTKGGLLNHSGSVADAGFNCCPDQAGLIGALIDAHRVDRLGVMGLMTSNALDRVRTSALRTFAAAFLLGRKRDG